MNKSIIGSFYTLSACIDKIPDIELTGMGPKNGKQGLFKQIYRYTKDAKIREIETMIDIGRVDRVNQFLRDNGFNIQLDPLSNPNDLAIVGIFELYLKWFMKGKEAFVNYNHLPYKAVNLKWKVDIITHDSFINPIARVVTRNGDVVYMVIPDVPPKNAFETNHLGQMLINRVSAPRALSYENRVIFPKIDLNIKPDLSWLVGLTDKKNVLWEIKQALQQTKVKMDEVGVDLHEAVAIGVTRGCSIQKKEPLIINKPFLMVVERRGLSLPLFSAYLNTDGWVR